MVAHELNLGDHFILRHADVDFVLATYKTDTVLDKQVGYREALVVFRKRTFILWLQEEERLGVLHRLQFQFAQGALCKRDILALAPAPQVGMVDLAQLSLLLLRGAHEKVDTHSLLDVEHIFVLAATGCYFLLLAVAM